MPLENRNFDQLIDFTRTSAATFVNSSGNIASTPQSRNLLTFTQEFANAAWTKTNSQIVPNVNPAAATLGAELGNAALLDKRAATGGTVSRSGGIITFTADPSALSTAISQEITVTPGRLYRFRGRMRYVSGTAGVQAIQVRTASGGGGSETGTVFYSGGTSFQTIDLYFVPTSSTVHATFLAGAANVIEVEEATYSVREVIGGALQAPDGTFTADTLVAAAGTGFIPRVADTSVLTVNGAAHTASMYVRAGTYTFFQIYINNQAAEWANFTLTGAGTASANGSCTATITALSGGWYRCTMSYTAGGTDRRPLFMMAASGSATRAQTWNPAGTETIFIWGAQLEQASAATDYTRNFGGLFPPRFDYDPVTRAPRGLLIEEQRTNLLLRSEEFDAGNWTKSRTTATANATTSPDGTVDADKITETTDAGTHRVFQQAAKAASVLTRTFSVYLKSAERTRARIQVSNNNESVSTSADVNLSAGTITNASNSGSATVVAVGSSITNAGNGWYRCTITATYDATVDNPGAFVFILDNTGAHSYTGDGTSGIFAWGAQWEDGAFATSYIPTVASQVTRTADSALIQAPNFASWFNQPTGTFVVEASTLYSNASDTGTIRVAFTADDGTTNNVHRVYHYTNRYGGSTIVGGVSQTDMLLSTIAVNTPAKVAYAYAANDFSAAMGGVLGTPDTSGSLPTPTRLSFGGLWNVNGHIRSLRYYPARLTNAQLQALTA